MMDSIDGTTSLWTSTRAVESSGQSSCFKQSSVVVTIPKQLVARLVGAAVESFMIAYVRVEHVAFAC